MKNPNFTPMDDDLDGIHINVLNVIKNYNNNNSNNKVLIMVIIMVMNYLIQMDDGIGNITIILEQYGYLNDTGNTLIIFSSDNGG